MAILANLLNPEVVILGGYYVPLAPWLLPAAEAELRARTIAPDAGGCQVVASTLGHGAAALGGAARVLDSVDSAATASPPTANLLGRSRRRHDLDRALADGTPQGSSGSETPCDRAERFVTLDPTHPKRFDARRASDGR